MITNPSQVVAAFASAVKQGDEGAARALCEPEFWGAEHGDAPKRLFTKAAHPQRGFAIKPLDVRSGAESSRAAVRCELVREDRGTIGEVHLLGTGADPWRIGGVSKSERFINAYLDGTVPPLLRFDGLVADSDAADSVVAISALALQAKHGNPLATQLIESLMNETDASLAVVGWLQHAAGWGWQVRVLDARKSVGLGRSVAKCNVVKPSGDEELVWLFGESGPPIAWYAQTTFFSVDALLA